MGLFRSQSVPMTSYGYQPPGGATVHGWVCTNNDCSVSEHEPVKRWPKACTTCGSPADPLLDVPWKHEAEGVELQWILQNHPERGGGFYRDQWEVWQFRDAALRGDLAGIVEARRHVRAYVSERSTDKWWGPGSVFFHFVWVGIEVSDLDGAADDLCYWLSISSSDDVENNNTNRTNCRQVIDMSARFLAALGGRGHPRVPEISKGCLSLAEGAYQVLNREQQNTIAQMARS